MQEADLTKTQEAVDVQIQGPEAVPVRGLQATIDFPGVPLQSSDVERLFGTIFDQADNYRKSFEPKWRKGYTQYNGTIDESGKLPWQSRIHVPKPKKAVDKSTSKVMSAIFNNEDFFDILPSVQPDDARVDVAKKMVKWQLRKSEYRQPVQTSIKDAFICGFGPMKVTYEIGQRPVTVVDKDPLTGVMGFQTKMEKRNRLRMDPIIPFDFWLDPTGRNRFVIHRTKRDISSLWALAEDQIDPLTGQIISPAVYDREAVKRVRAGNSNPERDANNAVVRQDAPLYTTDTGVDVYEFWGDFHDPSTGVLLYRNVVITFAGQFTMIRKPQQNPFRHGNSPFVVFHPVLAPHQIYSVGLLESGFSLQDGLDRAWNIVMDKMMLQVPTVQAYPSSLRNQNDLGQDNQKFYPGRTWLGKDPEKPIFVPVDGFQPPTDQDFVVTDKLGSFHDQSTGVNELATGTPQTNNRKTKVEIQERAMATDETFNDAAAEIETSGLSPLIKMVYYLMVQFEQNYSDPELLRMFGEQQQPIVQMLATLTPEQRWEAMFLDAEFRVTGVTLAATRNDRIQRMMNWKSIVTADPAMNAIVNRREEMRWWMQMFDIPQHLILDPTMAAIQAEETALLMQILGPNMGQTPQGGGDGTNASNATSQGAADTAKQEETAAPKSKEQQ